MVSQREPERYASMQRVGVSSGPCDHSRRVYSRRRGHKSKLYAVPPIFSLTPICDDSGRALRLPEGVMSCMATYIVIPKVDHTGFHIAIAGSDGVRQTILGFDTRADAEAGILRDKWLSAADRP